MNNNLSLLQPTVHHSYVWSYKETKQQMNVWRPVRRCPHGYSLSALAAGHGGRNSPPLGWQKSLPQCRSQKIAHTPERLGTGGAAVAGGAYKEFSAGQNGNRPLFCATLALLSCCKRTSSHRVAFVSGSVWDCGCICLCIGKGVCVCVRIPEVVIHYWRVVAISMPDWLFCFIENYVQFVHSCHYCRSCRP